MLYIDNPIDRADHLRKQAHKIDELWSTGSTKLIPYSEGQFWVKGTANETVDEPLFKYSDLVTLNTQQHSGDCSHRIFLGFLDNEAWFALDYTDLPVKSALMQQTQAHLQNLRSISPLLDAQQGAILAYAQAVLHWHKHSRFCQVCGNKNTLINAGHVQSCSDTGCRKETFPRTDAAVIMLVVDKPKTGPERALLGRSAQWPLGVYSTLAGFVEPGETLEDAVRREVFEEAGVNVGEVEYQASQPWPYPQSMMLGFRAQAMSAMRYNCLDPILFLAI